MTKFSSLRHSLVVLVTTVLVMLAITMRTSVGDVTGAVTGKEAVFRFPAPHDGPWHWHTPDTPDDRLEYGWELRTPGSDGKRYAFGFMLFKIPGEKEGYGPLNMLLFTGQESLWTEDEYGRGSVIEGVNLTVETNPDRIVLRPDNPAEGTPAHPASSQDMVVIRLTDPVYLRLLFDSKPPTVKATIWADGKKNEFDVPVSYAD